MVATSYPIIGTIKRTRLRKSAPPFVPGSRSIGRFDACGSLLDIFNTVVVLSFQEPFLLGNIPKSTLFRDDDDDDDDDNDDDDDDDDDD